MFELPTIRLPRNAWLLNCCVSPQSEIARVRVDRSLIGAPSDFRHIGHLGAGDLHSADNGNSFGALLRSKGGPEFAMAIPRGIREADVPIGGQEKEGTKEDLDDEEKGMKQKQEKMAVEVEERWRKGVITQSATYPPS